MLFKTFEKYLTNRRGAIHVGAHEGGERSWYFSQGFTPVLWFEPNVDVFQCLVENLRTYEDQVAFNIGIHDELKNATLHIASNRGQSSSILDFGTHKDYRPDIRYISDQEIRMMRMDNFLFLTGRSIRDYNFLNIDVQGVELNVIKSFGNLLKGLDYIYTEVNEEELYKGCALVSEIDSYVANFGFKRVSTYMTKNKWGDAFYINGNI
jgi:FkbM family methyltransferase